MLLAVPASVAVIVPALKFLLASRATIVPAVLASVASEPKVNVPPAVPDAVICPPFDKPTTPLLVNVIVPPSATPPPPLIPVPAETVTELLTSAAFGILYKYAPLPPIPVLTNNVSKYMFL